MPPLSRNRRVSRRKSNRTLSNYKIATRTSASAQSRQIYALKRQIQRIQHRTKPEVITFTRNSVAIDLSAAAGGTTTWYTGSTTGSSAPITQIITPSLGVASPTAYGSLTTDSPNNFARLASFTVYGDLRFTGLTNANVPVTLRIVVIQTKTTRSDHLTESDVFTASNTGASGSSFSQVFGPLQTGLSRTAKVLSDKRYTLSYQRPSATIKTRLRYLLNFYRDSSSSTTGSSEPIPKGAIYVFYASYTLANDQTHPTLRLMCKLAYFDN